MQPRTEAEILAKAPLKVKLGAQDYAIPILTILPSREWRLKLDAALGDIVDSFRVMDSVSSKDLSQALTGALLRFPEKVAELVFQYAGECLPKDEILAAATEEQMAAAFSAIMQVAYPYLPSLATTMKVMRAQQSQPATAKFTN